MERALNLERLRIAMGDHGRLPTPERLQELLADTELGLLRGTGTVTDELLEVGWYLHAIGSASRALDIYPVDRQRRAHQVAAHVLDLALQTREYDEVGRLQTTFAAQVSYLRGGLDPNAIALYRRTAIPDIALTGAPGLTSLVLGSMLLALDRPRLFPAVQALRDEAALVDQTLEIPLRETPLAATDLVRAGVWELLLYLTYGDARRLLTASGLFTNAMTATASAGDLDSRWVAAHLRDIGGGLAQSSVWAVLPPNVPVGPGKAMTMGDPPVLSLWPPQLELLQVGSNPLDPATRRLVISLPTSAGKTLLSQLFVVTHLTAVRESNVCIVAPTHSLCREIKQALDRRLATLAHQAHDDGPVGTLRDRHPSARVVVMTPEKLASRIRNDPAAVLAEFSLFVIDEAHLLGDPERGWGLEAALSFLHLATSHDGAPHRIILMSAALGNRAHIQQWLDPGAPGSDLEHQDWRGPRRVHSIYTTPFLWGQTADRPVSKRSNPRRDVPVAAELHVRVGPGKVRGLRWTEPVGVHVEALSKKKGWKRDSKLSTPIREHLLPLILHLGRFGPVLVIEPTKTEAQRLAQAIAARLPEDPALRPLSTLVRLRMAEHPLAEVLDHGVAFHHAALPLDIQAELEDAVRAGELQYLVSTTTLAEGVNLPVRSVVIAGLDYWGEGGEKVVAVDAARLVNAVGRAGRATKESEGWVVLASRTAGEHDFAKLTGGNEALDVTSALTTTEALEGLAAFEDAVRQNEDAVFEFGGRHVNDFLSYVWFLATSLSAIGKGNDAEAVLEALASTLAWQELDAQGRERWSEAAVAGLAVYERTPTEQRHRWARSGLALPATRALEDLTAEIYADVLGAPDIVSPAAALDLLTKDGRFGRVLERIDRPPIFKKVFNAPRTAALAVDQLALLRDWLAGMDLPELADRYLAEVPDDDYRYEQLSEYTTKLFEHGLPWICGVVIAWVNLRLDNADFRDDRLCPDLPGFIRFGVDSPAALELLAAGVRSRRLAKVVAGAHSAAGTEDEVRSWLCSLDWIEWREVFMASPAEIADLLTFTRAADARLAARALAGEVVRMAFTRSEPGDVRGPAALRHVEEPPPARIGVWAGEQLVGHVRAEHQNDVELLLRVGVPFAVATDDWNDGVVTVQVDDYSEE